MQKTALMYTSLLALGIAFSPAPASATAEFDACVRKLCVNTEQGDCWIKGGAQLCDKNQKSCRELEDHTFPKIVRKVGKMWEVETKSGNGWVNQRWMMVSGDKC